MMLLARLWQFVPPAFPALLLATGLKATVLLACAGCATTLLRRAPAATRHLVWLLALAACVALPFVSALTPALRVTVPAGITRAIADVAPGRMVFEPSAAPVAVAPDPARAPTGAATAGPRTDAGDDRAAAPPPESTAARAATLGRHARTLPRPGLPQAVATLWVAGFALVLARRLLAAIRVAWIARRAAVVIEPAWLVAVTRHATRLGIRRAVGVRRGADVAVPMTCGTLAPIVLLPPASADWNPRRRELVLIHELAHVRRRDTLALLLAQVALAIYWFHPLAWVAVRRLRDEAERACDDLVLRAGLRPSAYAEDLIDIARQAADDDGLGAAALAMARRSQLEGRLLAILDPLQPRGGTGRLTCGIALGVALPVVVLLAALAPRAGGDATPDAHVEGTHAVPQATDAPRVPVAATTVASTPHAPEAAASAREAADVAAPETPADVAPLAAATPAPAPMAGLVSTRSGTRSSWNIVQDDGGPEITTGSWVGPGFTASYKGKGKTTFTLDLRDIRTMAPGATLELEEEVGGVTRRAAFRSRAGAIERRFWVGDEEQPWVPAGQEWLGAFLVGIDRRTGAFVEERFPVLMKSGGADAVLDEVARMSSDHGEYVYLKKLLTADLDDATLRRVVVIAGRTIASDHERAEALAAVAGKNALASEATRRAFLTALDGIESDYEHARVLMLLLDRDDLSADVTRDALRSVAGVESDYERSRLLTAMAEHGHVAAPDQREYIRACTKIESSYYRGQTLKSLLEHARVDAALLPALLEASTTFDSDYERANLLIAIVERSKLDAAARESLRRSSAGLGDYERKRVLASLGETDSR